MNSFIFENEGRMGSSTYSTYTLNRYLKRYVSGFENTGSITPLNWNKELLAFGSHIYYNPTYTTMNHNKFTNFKQTAIFQIQYQYSREKRMKVLRYTK